MATAPRKKAAKETAAKNERKSLAPPPAPAAGNQTPQVGVDPRTVDGSTHEDAKNISGGGYVDGQGHVHAAPPTPTRESAATANDAPGAGGEVKHSSRRTLLEGANAKQVKVHVAKPFKLTDATGVEHHYSPGEQDMAEDHADHWYAKAHGVKKLDDE